MSSDLPTGQDDGAIELEGDFDMFQEPVGFRPPSPQAKMVDHISSNGHRLMKLRLVGGHSLWGHVLYPAAIAMSKYLEEHANTLLRSNPNDNDASRGKYVLELGAGAGLPGLTSVLEGAELVVSTDFPDRDLIENLKQNADLNLPANVRGRLVVEGFRWGANPQCLLNHLPATESAPNSNSHDAPLDSLPVAHIAIGFDLILLSDVVFNHSQHQALLETCEDCLRRTADSSSLTGPSLLMFYSHHRPRFVKQDNQLIQLAKERGWTCKKVVEDSNAGLAFPEDDGDPFIRGTVHGMRKF